MTGKEAAKIINECKDKGFKHTFYTLNEYHTALDMAAKALEQEVPDTNVGNIDCISREDAIRIASGECHFSNIPEELKKLPPVNPQLKTGHCKDCKYFEYDSVAKVNGIPLIVAHEICSRWGDGCKTSEYGYCFLFEPKAESEG